jgi:ABC-2 type transport system ATP-binding protein
MTLQFDRITFSYSRFRAPVLRDFSWTVPPGRTVLLGPNGAGKSTLLSLGADALRPRRGSVHFGNLDARRGARSGYRRSIGWMPQEIRAVPGFTTREQVAYAGWLKGLSRRASWEDAPATLVLVGLDQLADRPASTLSGGELRRLGIAQTLIHQAKILLLDEPTAGLDPAQRARFRELITALPRECQIVVSTHQVDDLSELFDTVVVLVRGVIRYADSVGSFLRRAGTVSDARGAEAAYAGIIEEHA